MESEKLKLLLSWVEYPEETALTEYKAAIKFDPRSEFGAKLVKHILGQANAGGGYIVIGFVEEASGKLHSDPKLSTEISRSYETTRLCQSVDKYLRGQRIELQVHKVSHRGRDYPIISVQGFRETPFFCAKDGLSADKKHILKEGAVYVRDRAAKTVVVAGPEHWNILLKIAIKQRQEEILSQLQSILGQLGTTLPMGRPPKDSTARGEIEGWFQRERQEANRRMQQHSLGHVGYIELLHFPRNVDRTWSQADLLAAAQRAVCRNTGWPMGVVLTTPDHAPHPLPDGIRTSIFSTIFAPSFDYWSFEKRGAFYLLRAFEEDLRSKQPQKVLWFDSRIWRVTEAFLHCSNLHRALGVESDSEIEIEISHYHLEGRQLSADNPRRDVSPRKCEADEVHWQKALPLGAIESGLETLVREVLGELFVLFEYWKPAEQVWNGVIGEFLRSRV